jgi:cold-inducible RNA-binding protein
VLSITALPPVAAFCEPTGLNSKENKMNIYVGNLSYEATDDELRELFEEFGEVSSASVIQDRESGRSRGFGFVEMPNDAEAQAAIDGLNGRDVQGRSLRVNEARPREERPPRRDGGFRSTGSGFRSGGNQRGGGGRRSW